MACPFFMPTGPLDPGDWLHAPRFPLGDAYRGDCHAVAAAIVEPIESDQRELCNCGYARGRCARISTDSADAMRFSIAEDVDGVIRVVWIEERAHSPRAFGSLAYSIGEAELRGKADEILAAQARAFIQSYMRRRPVSIAASAR